MKEQTLSTMDELIEFTNEYSCKKYYYRGENKDYGGTSCLPQILRPSQNDRDLPVYNEADRQEWVKKMLDTLNGGAPYIPRGGNTENDYILNALLNIDSFRWFPCGDEKLEAIITHYSSDFYHIIEKNENENNLVKFTFPYTFMDVTPDIMVALHFACSEYHLLKDGENPENLESENPGDGFLFVFDLSEIEKNESLKLVEYPGYAYFVKNEDKFYFQPFDRITHQRGAFLSPKVDVTGTLDCEKYKIAIKGAITEKITISKQLKIELYNIFGGEDGLDYYFPEIDIYQEVNKTRRHYVSLRGITLLEMRESNLSKKEGSI